MKDQEPGEPGRKGDSGVLGASPVGPGPSFTAVILAAGKGTRMKSTLPKVLHPLAGEPLLAHVLRAVRDAGAARVIVVVGYGAEAVEAAFAGQGLEFVRQEPQLGTGHAVMQAAPLLEGEQGVVLVGYGDMPLLRADTLRRLVAAHQEAGVAATVLTGTASDPGAYGRIVRDERGRFLRIVEARDASPQELEIREINTGTYCFQAPQLLAALRELRPDNAQGEYYLTDVPAILAQRGGVQAVNLAAEGEWQGINSPTELAEAERLWRQRFVTGEGLSGRVSESGDR